MLILQDVKLSQYWMQRSEPSTHCSPVYVGHQRDLNFLKNDPEKIIWISEITSLNTGKTELSYAPVDDSVLLQWFSTCTCHRGWNRLDRVYEGVGVYVLISCWSRSEIDICHHWFCFIWITIDKTKLPCLIYEYLWAEVHKVRSVQLVSSEPDILQD